MNQSNQPTETVLTAVQKAITAAKAGNKPLARHHLEKLVATEHDNPDYWLWLAWTADSPVNAISALEQVLRLSPDHELARSGMSWAAGMQGYDPEAYLASELAESSNEVTVVPTDSAPAHPTEGVATDTFVEELAIESSSESQSHFNLPSDTDAAISPIVDTDDGADSDKHTSDEQRDGEPIEPVDVARHDEPSGTDIATDTNDSLVDALEKITRDPHTSSAAETPSTTGEAIRDTVPAVKASRAVYKTDNDTVDLTRPARPEDHLTVLVVDDSPTIRKIVSMNLENAGYQVSVASDGMEALQHITTCKPSLILTDINMPRLDGYQLCKLVKSHEKTRTIPVIMLSGKDGMFDKIRGKFVGCDDYITKPFESVDLLKKVSSYLPILAETASPE